MLKCKYYGTPPVHFTGHDRRIMQNAPSSEEPTLLITTPPLKASEVKEGDLIFVWNIQYDHLTAVGVVLKGPHPDERFARGRHLLTVKWHFGTISQETRLPAETFSA